MTLTRIYRTSVLVFTAALVVACSSQPAATTGSITLETERQPTAVCQQALLTGQLVQDPDTGLAIAGPNGEITKVTWPYGYSAQTVNGKLTLVDANGNTVAAVGDQVELAGGSGGDGVWHACAGTVRKV